MAAIEVWNFHHQVFRIEPLTSRVGDMELLALLLLGTSGLYALVFAASSYFSGTGFARQADQTVRQMRQDMQQLIREITPAPVAGVADSWETQIAEIIARLRFREERPLSDLPAWS
jgi:hypothetical protein